MAWTAPMTAIANTKFTAAEFNLYLRDNLNFLKTEMDGNPRALATTAGGYFVATGANAIAQRLVGYNQVLTSQGTTTSGSYVDLATVGPTVNVTTGTQAKVTWGAMFNPDSDAGGTAGSCSVAVSGATTITASDSFRFVSDGQDGSQANTYTRTHLFTTLNAGSNTFTLKYKATDGFFAERFLLVEPL